MTLPNKSFLCFPMAEKKWIQKMLAVMGVGEAFTGLERNTNVAGNCRTHCSKRTLPGISYSAEIEVCRNEGQHTRQSFGL